jgi:hypothetical protein
MTLHFDLSCQFFFCHGDNSIFQVAHCYFNYGL